MKRLLVQIEGRQGHTHRLEANPGEQRSIGRAYDNDLILPDPHIDPNALSLKATEQGWLMQVHDTLNPVQLNSRAVEPGEHLVSDGDRVLLGRTRLRFLSAEHPVEPTRPLLLSRAFGRDQMSVFFPFAILLLICSVDAVAEYFQFSLSLDWQESAAGALLSMLIVIVWAGFWSALGQLLRHQHHFKSQLLATSLVLIIPMLTVPLLRYAQFYISDAGFELWSIWALAFVTMLVLLRLNLYFATNLKRCGMVALFIVSSISALAYAGEYFHGLDQLDTDPKYSSIILPPLAPHRAAILPDDYLQRLADSFDN